MGRKTVFSEEQTKSDAYRRLSGRRPAPPQGRQPWFRWSGSSARSHPRRRRLHGRRSTMQVNHNVFSPSVAEQMREHLLLAASPAVLPAAHSHACPCRICASPHRPPPHPAETTPQLTSNSPRPKSSSARPAGGDQPRRGGRRLHSGGPRPCQPARCPVGRCSPCAQAGTELPRPLNRGPPQV